MALSVSDLLAGVALAVILSSVRHISDKVFLEAAKVSLGAEQAVASDTPGVCSDPGGTQCFPVWFFLVHPSTVEKKKKKSVLIK